MKKNLLLLCFLFFFSLASAFAQGKTRNTAEQRATIYTNDLTKALTLSADQKSKVLEINVKMNKAIDAAEASKDGEKEKAAKKERREAIAALLDAKQKAKFDKMNGGK